MKGRNIYIVIIIIFTLLSGSKNSYACLGIDTVFGNVSDTLACPNQAITFTGSYNLSSGYQVDSVFWVISGKKHYSSEVKDTVFATTGNYSAWFYLFVSKGGINCSDSVKVTLRVVKPTADITLPAIICSGVPITINSSGSVNAIDFDWEVDGSIINNQPTISHTFNASQGSGKQDFPVKLTVTDSVGCTDIKNVVAQVNRLPKVNSLNLPTNICSGTSFTIIPNVEGNSLTYAWLFDGSSPSTAPAPTHTFNIPDGSVSLSKIITLTITTGDGCNKTTNKSETVIVNPKPAVDFTFTPDSACSPVTVTFNNTSIPASSTYAWNFGNGQTSTVKNPLIGYSSIGLGSATFNTTLTVTSPQGCLQSLSKTITVRREPQINFRTKKLQYCINPDSGKAILVNRLNGVTHSKYRVNWSDGTIDTFDTWAYNGEVIHKYANLGNYLANIWVRGANGCTNDTSIELKYNGKPSVLLKYPLANEVCEGTPIVLINATDTILPLTSYTIDFDDGTQDVRQGEEILADTTKRTVIHIFPTNCSGGFWAGSSLVGTGGYLASLTATNGCGSATSKWEPLKVYPKPKPLFTKTRVCKSDSTVFTNLTTFQTCQNKNISFRWYFGDGDSLIFNGIPKKTSAIQQVVKHLYPDTGIYTAKLVACDSVLNGACNCVTYTDTVIVQKPPIVRFGAERVCLNSNSIFLDSSYARDGATITNRRWFFGDGDLLISNFVPTHNYLFADTFNVKQVVFDNYGCSDSAVRLVIVDSLPLAYFLFDTVCEGFESRFNSISQPSGLIDSLFWSFGDGSFGQSDVDSIKHVYSAGGEYWVNLQVMDTLGCRNDSSRLIRVWKNPIADFNLKLNVCLGDTQDFINTTQKGDHDSLFYFWEFGDGNTSFLENPKHVYNSIGLFTVRLTVSDGYSCSSIIEKQFNIRPIPVVNFSFTRPCLGDTMYFTDLSDSLSAFGNKWQWQFDYPNTSSYQNSKYLYTTSDSHSVKLIVTTGYGCIDSTTKRTFVKYNPIAIFEGLPVCLGDITKFISKSIPVGTIDSLAWNFGDGNFFSTKLPDSAKHTYSTHGIFWVHLRVTDTANCIDDTAIQVRVYKLPDASFLFDSICPGDSQYFNNQTVLGDTSSIRYKWSFGDGFLSDSINPIHAYDSSGLFVISLIATDGHGCKDTYFDSIYILPKPNSSFSANTVCLGQATEFVNLSSNLTPTGNKYFWTINNLTGIIDTSFSTNYVYPDSGWYSVSLVVETGIGCKDTFTQPIYVRPNPIANFLADTVCKGEQTLFNDISFYSQGTTFSGRRWSFDTISIMSPKHTFSNSGIMPIWLKVWDNFGCTDSVSKSVRVKPLPIPDFSTSSGCEAQALTFKSTSVPIQGYISDYLWNFGIGGPTSDSVEPVIVFPNANTYNVKLTVTNSLGCSNDTTKLITIYSKPTALFNAQPVCLGTATVFQNGSLGNSGAITNNRWWYAKLDSFNIPTTLPTSNIFPDSGKFWVRLKVTNDKDCFDSTSKMVVVYQLPKVDFSANEVCQGEATKFNNLSTTNGGSSLTKHTYNLDGYDTIVFAPEIVFPSYGNKTITLTVTNSNGCSDLKTKVIKVKPNPIPSFSVPNICNDSTIEFADNSTVIEGSIDLKTWNFGDGSLPQFGSPILHQYNTSGLYQVKLKIDGNNGCSDSIVKPVTVKSLPTVDFTYEGKCKLSPITFKPIVDSTQIVSYRWEFDNGQMPIFGPTATVIFNQAGSYIVKLIVIDLNGCQSEVTRTVNILNLPNIGFSALPTCLGNKTQFIDSSSSTNGSVVFRNWRFGDDSTSLSINPSHEYTASGTYTAVLVAKDNMGCVDSAIRQVNIRALPIVSIANQNACLGNVVNFYGSASVATGANISAYSWDFGNGQFSTDTNPTTVFNVQSTYLVKLEITDNYGCKGTGFKSVTVSEKPFVNFVADTVCFGDSTHFTNLSNSISGSIITNNLWNFGEGPLIDVINPIFRFQSAGLKNVQLKVNDNLGCESAITKAVWVRVRPLANFSFDANLCFSDSNNFINNSIPIIGYPLILNKWWFGDGDSSVVFSPKHKYLAPGIYSVKLTTIDSVGCSDDTIKTISVPLPIDADFSVTQSCEGKRTLFTNTSELFGDSILSVLWEFGDGTTEINNADTLSHKYPSAGSYLVKVYLTSNKGCIDSVFKSIQVYGTPVAQFSVQNKCLGENININCPVSSNIKSYFYDFGDGVGSSTLRNPDYLYTNSGNYLISFTITDNNNCQNSNTKWVSIYANPTVSITANNVCLNQNSLLNGAGSSAVSGSSIEKYEWTIGALTIDTTPLLNYLFTSPGIKNISLKVTDGNGCSTTGNKSLVINSLPIANFSYPIICGNNPFKFTNLTSTSGGSIINYSWNFGDGSSSDSSSPIHQFVLPNTYAVRLLVTDNNGCKDTVEKDVKAYSLPIASFTSDSVCYGLPSTIINNSVKTSAPLVQSKWIFPDTTLFTFNPQYIFKSWGSLPVKLVITDSVGCIDTASKNVFVHALPAPNFIYVKSCLGDSTRFVNQTKVNGGDSIQVYFWSFGNGVFSSSKNPSAFFNTVSNKQVKLIATNLRGCTDSVIKFVEVYPKPIPDFSIIPACLGENTFFDNTSIGVGSSIVTTKWYFTAIDSSSSTDGNYIFYNAGTYLIKLQVSDSNQCSADTIKSYVVNPKPEANFSFVSSCSGAPVKFNNTSNIPNGLLALNWDFGDGIGTSSDTNPEYTYSSGGNFSVRLVLTDSLGCSDTIIKQVIISGNPMVNFGAKPVCIGGFISLKDSTKSGNYSPLASFKWFYDDSLISQYRNPVYKFSSAGLQKLKLIVSDSLGCTDSLEKSILIYPQPVAQFSANPVCNDSISKFTQLSLGTNSPIKQFRWNFGDGGIDTISSPTHKYTNFGTYSVRLIVVDSNSCSDTANGIAQVYQPPTVRFVNLLSCNNKPVQFFDSSYSNSGKGIRSLLWDFAGLGGASEPITSFLFPSGGNYTIRLTVTDSNNCSNYLDKNIQLLNSPNPNFKADSVCFGAQTVFINQSLNQSPTMKWAWYLGDDTLLVASPSYLFNSPGDHWVTLKMVDANGCSEQISKIVHVKTKPQADFLFSNICLGDSVVFNNNSSTPTSSHLSSFWSFGDGKYDSSFHSKHLYSIFGDFFATLYLRATNGCNDTITKKVVVHNPPSTAISVQRACLGQPNIFSSSTNYGSAPIANYVWTFEGGSQSYDSAASFTFSSSGLKDVYLVVTDSAHCSDTAFGQAQVDTLPEVDFRAITGCYPQPVQFENLSKGKSSILVSRLWNFGDSVTSSEEHPKHKYNDYGLFNVSLRVTDFNGCIGAKSKDIRVNPKPSAQFFIPNHCHNSQPQIINLSTSIADSIVEYRWDLGDTVILNIKNPSHKWADSGTYNVNLIVGTDSGCTDTASLVVIVHPKPTAQFFAPRSCFGQPNNFINQTELFGAPLQSIFWNFGDGSPLSSAQPNTQHNYLHPNSYLTTMFVSNTFGCADTTSKTVLVDSLPSVNFLAENNCINDTTTFYNLSRATSNNLNSYFWDFGDGTNSPKQAPKHLFETQGSYTITLRVTDIMGCVAEKSKIVNVYPKPNFNINALINCSNDTSEFSTSYIPNSTNSQLIWNLNGTILDGSSVKHRFNAGGNFDVSLTIIDSNNCTYTLNKQVFVPTAPTAQFVFNDTCFGKPTAFQDQSAKGDTAKISSWYWTLNGALVPFATSSAPFNIMPFSGSNLVQLRVIDNRGCADSIVKPVVVESLPNVSFSFSDKCLGDTVYFINNAIPTGVGSSITKYMWSFGDTSAVNNTANPQHFYSMSGKYLVRLTVNDNKGCSGVYSDSVEIFPLPAPDFVFRNACVNQAAFFCDSSQLITLGNAQYLWDFGDSVQESGSIVTHKFDSSKVYSVSLLVTNSKGCSRKVSKSIFINPIPIARFTHDTSCAKNGMYFTDQSKGSISDWKWHFGNGDSSGLQNPIRPYSAHGFYTVKLTVSDSNGCYDTDSAVVMVRPLPIPLFTTKPKCPFGITKFDNQSITVYSTDSVVKYRWDFGDATPNVWAIKSPEHTYQSPGDFSATLQIWDNNGCTDSLTKNVAVPLPPIPDFDFTGTCSGSPTIFSLTNQISIGQISSSLWEFGDGNQASGNNVSHTYSDSGLYKITLTLTDTGGCMRSIEKHIFIHPKPKANFTFSNNCLGDTTLFFNQSEDGGFLFTNYVWSRGGLIFDTSANPKYSFTNSGSYPISLVVKNSNGCSDTLVKQIQVYPRPLPNFEALPVCKGAITSFMNQTIVMGAGIKSYLWEFGEGISTSQMKNPQYKYPLPGGYLVTLHVIDSNNCTAQQSDSVFVWQNPMANFDVFTTCLYDSIRFKNNSYSTIGINYNSKWNFSNGDSTYNTNPKIYAGLLGKNWAQLIITDSHGCKDTAYKEFNVAPRPIASFSTNIVCNGQVTTFTNSSTSNNMGSTSSWWNFGDGETLSESSPFHHYLNYGEYLATLIFTDGNSCSDTAQRIVKILRRPEARIFAPSNSCQFENIALVDSSLSYNHGLKSRQWNINNGLFMGYVSNFMFKSIDTGVFNVQLVVVDSANCTDTVLHQLKVHQKPEIDILSKDTVCVQVSNPFQIVSDITLNNGLWLFGDNSNSSWLQTTHAYTQAGLFNLVAIGYTSMGCSDTASKVILSQTLATPNFSKSHDSLCGPGLVNYLNASTGLINSLLWNFGNGISNININNPNTIYQPGLYFDTTYYVSLTLFNECGTATKVDSIKIFPQPIARFNLNTDSGCSPLKVEMNNISIGKPTQFIWDLDNGNNSLMHTPPAQYYNTQPNDTSVYSIKLVAVNSCGADTAQQNIHVFPNTVKAFFNVDKTYGCQGVNITFTGFAENATSYFYDFGDGYTSTTFNPQHTFNQQGTFLVSQVASDGCGSDTAVQSIEVFPKPIIDFSISPNDTVCLGDTIRFVNNSVYMGSAKWYFGYGDSVNTTSPLKVFNSAGSHQVWLQVSSVPHGCKADTAFNVFVLPIPAAKIDTNIFQKVQCEDIPMLFISKSSGGNIRWYFGDGDSSNIDSVWHAYAQSGFYKVTLWVKNNNGCRNKTIGEVQVGDRPKSAFSMSSSYSCDSLASVLLKDKSIGAFEVNWNFGNGLTSDSLINKVFYSDTGSYLIRHIAFANNGCSDTSYNTFQSIRSPKLDFGIDSTEMEDQSVCFGETVYLKNYSTDFDSLIWDFGQGDLKYNEDNTFDYFKAGKYTITLIAFNHDVCSDTLRKEGFINVNPMPNAKFFYQNIDTLVNGISISFGKVEFVSQSREAKILHWDFGDSAQQTTIFDSIIHRYANPGPYTVNLEAVSDSGCVGEETQLIEVDYFAGLHIPNAIYPDGKSDAVATFLPQGVFLQRYKIMIFDTWGNMIWEKEGVDALGGPAKSTAWEGKDEYGRLLPAGAYIYKVVYQFRYNNEVFTKTGDITIIR